MNIHKKYLAAFFLCCFMNIKGDGIDNLYVREFLSLLRRQFGGITVSDEAISIVEKFKGNENAYEYVILKINDGTNSVSIDDVPDYGSTLDMDEYKDLPQNSASYKRLRDNLRNHSTAFAYYYVKCENEDPVLVLIAWKSRFASDNQKKKFIFAKVSLMKKFKVKRVVEPYDADDFPYEEIIDDEC